MFLPSSSQPSGGGSSAAAPLNAVLTGSIRSVPVSDVLVLRYVLVNLIAEINVLLMFD